MQRKQCNAESMIEIQKISKNVKITPKIGILVCCKHQHCLCAWARMSVSPSAMTKVDEHKNMILRACRKCRMYFCLEQINCPFMQSAGYLLFCLLTIFSFSSFLFHFWLKAMHINLNTKLKNLGNQNSWNYFIFIPNVNLMYCVFLFQNHQKIQMFIENSSLNFFFFFFKM